MYRTAVYTHVNDDMQKVTHRDQQKSLNSDITWATRSHWRVCQSTYHRSR